MILLMGLTKLRMIYDLKVLSDSEVILKRI
jgi:hypothetical protein